MILKYAKNHKFLLCNKAKNGFVDNGSCFECFGGQHRDQQPQNLYLDAKTAYRHINQEISIFDEAWELKIGVINFRTLYIIFWTITFFGFTLPLYRMISEEISLPCLSSRLVHTILIQGSHIQVTLRGTT